MDALAAAGAEKDHADSIKQRLEAIRDLFRLTRYRRVAGGDLEVGGEATGGVPRPGGTGANGGGGGGGGGGRGGRGRDLYAAFLEADGEPGEEVKPKTGRAHSQVDLHREEDP